MNSTLPWTFGQGRTHVSGWRYESRTDPPPTPKARPWRPMPFMPQRQVGITNPTVAEMHDWAGSTISFLRLTEQDGGQHDRKHTGLQTIG